MRIQGSLVSLRPAELEDRRTIYEWLAQSDLTSSMLGPPLYPDVPVPTWEEFCADYGPPFFDGSTSDVGRCFLIEVGGTVVGHVGYDGMDRQRSLAELDIWLRSSASCGHGYGPDALKALTEYLHRSFGIGTFILRPSARNHRAQHAYAKAGFQAGALSPKEKETLGPEDYSDTVFMIKRLPR